MTADVELLPLPKKKQLANPYAHSFGSVAAYGHTDDTLRDYARANVAHATEPLKAEIEALRAEVERLTFEMERLQQQYDERTACMIVHRGSALACSAAVRAAYSEEHHRAERLAEALHKLEDSCDDSDGAQYGTLGTAFVRGICKDALRDHDQEMSNG